MVMYSDEAKFGDIVTCTISGNVYFIIENKKETMCILIEGHAIVGLVEKNNRGLRIIDCKIKNKKEATPNEILKIIPKQKNEEIREKLKILLKERL